MCGIFVAFGPNCINDVLVGLKRLEYRGYDSCGIYGKDNLDDTYDFLVKDSSIANLEKRLANTKKDWRLAIGHTRWATHGKVNRENCQPILSDDGLVLLVHNGVVENLPIPEGQSDTKYIANDLSLTVRTMLRISDRDEGEILQEYFSEHERSDNAFVVYFPKWDKLFLICTGNGHLWISDEGYISSDLNSLSGFGCCAAKIQDITVELNCGEIAFDFNTKIPKQTFSSENTMLSEIYEQSDVLNNHFDLEIVNEIFNVSRINIYGCGSSYYAGMFSKLCLEEFGHMPTSVNHASEIGIQFYKYDELNLFISQSGETKDVLKAASVINTGTKVCVTNNEHSSIVSLVGDSFLLGCGQEIAVAATKTFTTTCVTLLDIALSLGGHRPIPCPKLEMPDDKLLRKLAEKYVGTKNFLLFGTGYNYPIALEGALKLKEVACVHAEGMPAAEIKHGPIALIDDEVVSIFIITDQLGSDESIISNMNEVKCRGGKIILITDEQKEKHGGLVDDVIVIPKVDIVHPATHVIQSLTAIFPLQILAYYLAIAKGLNPNRPRNLAKCVTV